MTEIVHTGLDALVLFRPDQGSLLARTAPAAMGTAPAAPALGPLLTEAVRSGWQGDLWRCCLTQALVESENPFSLACERREAVRDSLWDIALTDMAVYKALFDLTLPAAFGPVRDFRHDGQNAPRLEAGRRVQVLAEALAKTETAEDMLTVLTRYYERHGLGMLGLGQLFRVKEQSGRAALFPVEGRRAVKLSDLIGYETQKAQLVQNTEAFLAGRHANNVLLYGDAGTGKSTSVQAITNEYAGQGLRLIELYKHQFGLIPDLLSQIKGRNYRFILLLDDLSFEENEVEYKRLKAVMEGGGEAAPENVLIYATSNRRHLIRETWSDRSDMQHDGDVHRSDTMEEKLSLAGRFGLQIYYPNPTYEEYHAIVRTLARRTAGLEALTAEQLRSAASTWQVRHGSRSGRSAQQFINDLLCHMPELTKESETTHADPR